MIAARYASLIAFAQARAFCPNGEGNGVTNTCGSKELSAPDKDSGGGSASFPETWDTDLSRVVRKGPLPPGLEKLSSFKLGPNATPRKVVKLSQEMGIKSPEQLVTIGACNVAGADVTINLLSSNALTARADVPVGGGHVEIDTTMRKGEDGPTIDYGLLDLDDTARTQAANDESFNRRVAGQMYEVMLSSMEAAEKAGFVSAKTVAEGYGSGYTNGKQTKFQGYRLWGRFGFDAKIPPRWFASVKDKGVDVHSALNPLDRDQLNNEGSVRLQQLLATKQGEQIWKKWGIALGLTFDFTNKASDGYLRYRKMLAASKRATVKRDFFEYVAGLEMREDPDLWNGFAEERAFCPNGDGGGVTNTCGPDQTAKSFPEGSKNLRDAVDSVAPAPEQVWDRSRGLAETPAPKQMDDIANEQTSHSGSPLTPEAEASYGSLVDEIGRQYEALTAAGLKARAWRGEGEPYGDPPGSTKPNSNKMREEVAKTGEFSFFMTDKGFGTGDATPNHPMLRETKYKTADGEPMIANDLFRVVHDMVAHVRGGYSFSTNGEYNGMLTHASTLPEAAWPALFAETFGQNAVYEKTKNYAPQNAYASKVGPEIIRSELKKRTKSSRASKSDSDEPLGYQHIKSRPDLLKSLVEKRAFCATGEGNGIDNSCGAKATSAPDKNSGGGSGSGDYDPGHFDIGPDPNGLTEKDLMYSPTVKWTQDHKSLVRDAVQSWKGSPTDMTLHVMSELKGDGTPGSGSGKIMRAQATALLTEVLDNGEPAPTLYRGASIPPEQDPSPLLGWTSKKSVAVAFAKKNNGEVYTLEGATGLDTSKIKAHGMGEAEWIVAHKVPDGYRGAKAEVASVPKPKWMGDVDASGTTNHGTWFLEKNTKQQPTPWRGDDEATTHVVSLVDGGGKVKAFAHADLSDERTSLYMNYSEVAGPHRGQGVYKSLLDSLSEKFRVVSDEEHNVAPAAKKAYESLGARLDRYGHYVLDKKKKHEDRAFCPNGDGGGVTNTCGKGIGINDAEQDFTGQILSGEKTIETRVPNSLKPYIGKTVGIVRTGKGKATLVGVMKIGEPKFYKTRKEFDADYDKHRVGKDSPHYIGPEGKYGYPLSEVKPVKPRTLDTKGHVARVIAKSVKTRELTIEFDLGGESPEEPNTESRGDAPAPKKDKIKGSDVNDEGSAKNKSGDISLNESIIASLKSKAEEHNAAMRKAKKPSWTHVSLPALKAVYRRGAGAFSTSHRPGMTRDRWALARVNAFLTLARRGRPENAKYTTDNDLLHSSHPKHSKESRSDDCGRDDDGRFSSGNKCGGSVDMPKEDPRGRMRYDNGVQTDAARKLYQMGSSEKKLKGLVDAMGGDPKHTRVDINPPSLNISVADSDGNKLFHIDFENGRARLYPAKDLTTGETANIKKAAGEAFGGRQSDNTIKVFSKAEDMKKWESENAAKIKKWEDKYRFSTLLPPHQRPKKWERSIDAKHASLLAFAQSRGFCPNGEGNGVTNTCSSKDGGSELARIPKSAGPSLDPYDAPISEEAGTDVHSKLVLSNTPRLLEIPGAIHNNFIHGNSRANVGFMHETLESVGYPTATCSQIAKAASPMASDGDYDRARAAILMGQFVASAHDHPAIAASPMKLATDAVVKKEIGKEVGSRVIDIPAYFMPQDGIIRLNSAGAIQLADRAASIAAGDSDKHTAGWFSTKSLSHCLVHEEGHRIHFDALRSDLGLYTGTDRPLSKMDMFALGRTLEVAEAKAIVLAHSNPDVFKAIEKLSGYACTSPREAVAEYYAKAILTGKRDKHLDKFMDAIGFPVERLGPQKKAKK